MGGGGGLLLNKPLAPVNTTPSSGGGVGYRLWW
jgi:hypothetical protein